MLTKMISLSMIDFPPYDYCGFYELVILKKNNRVQKHIVKLFYFHGVFFQRALFTKPFPTSTNVNSFQKIYFCS